MKLFFSAGEPSGDVHGAALIEKIREYVPSADFVGFGGPKMSEAGCRLIVDLTQLAVMGIWQVLVHYFQFRRLLKRARQYFRTEPVDAVVLIDFPGFNWHIAQAAKEQGIPVYYFMPPQIWSWAQWRIEKMRRLVDGIFCPLPFEQRWFEEEGCNCTYVGHPFFEEMRKKQIDTAFLDELYQTYATGPVLTILPGSRNQEVLANLDDMLLAVEKTRLVCPQIKPVIAAYRATQAESIRARLQELQLSIPVVVGKTSELIQAAECCLAVSGSVSLELLACNKPTVIYYRVGKFSHFFQRFFRRARFITLVNLLAADREYDEKTGLSPVFYDKATKIIPAEPSLVDRDRMLFPEFLTATDRSQDVAAYFCHWFLNPAKLAKQKRLLADLLRHVDQIDSPLDRVARLLIEELQQ